MRISNDGPEVFSSCNASRKSRSEITVWMPWPLNRDLRGRAKWPSNHFRLHTARCICTEAQEMRAPCMFDWQGTQTFFSRWNAKPKFGLSCVHCIIQISQLLLSCVHCVIQNAYFKLKFKIRTLPLCENSLRFWKCDMMQSVFNISFTRLWLHGKISRERAEQLLKPWQDGFWLVRESTHYPGDFTLCVCISGRVEHYHIITTQPNDNSSAKVLTIDEDLYFPNLPALIQVVVLS